MQDGFIRVGAATPEIRVADCRGNREKILALIREADAEGVQVLVFPELCLTGYTCGDLFLNKTLLDSAWQSLHELLAESKSYSLLCAVGLPIAQGASIYNVAAVFQQGKLLGLVPKQNIPSYTEFYEGRYFVPGPQVSSIRFADRDVPFGEKTLFTCETQQDLCLAFEICEDLWSARPCSTDHALAGATIIGNLSASNELIAKAEWRRVLVQSQSGRLACAYIYANAGTGESTTDLVYAGHNLIYENGHKLNESALFTTGLMTADVDIQLLARERRRQNTFIQLDNKDYKIVSFSLETDLKSSLRRPLNPLPFVPGQKEVLASRCEEILQLQASGLATRLKHIGCKTAIIGVSGGLDSTLALLVTVKAFDALGLDRSGILAVGMPGFGTTERTRQNGQLAAKLLHVKFRQIPIAEAVMIHFTDIGHDPHNIDTTYENAQARERTQILMDLANANQGIVVGTGDLSEIALGWATYNGDHMSMYAVNSGVPKTLVRYLIEHSAYKQDEELRQILLDILDTPVSPELLPSSDNKISQETESIIGPYELHDFFLYYLIRYGFAPGKIERLANLAFANKYDQNTVRQWLRLFLRRFFSQQYKRSCMPDGPKIGTVALSPRGDWRMPSDACADQWLQWADK